MKTNATTTTVAWLALALAACNDGPDVAATPDTFEADGSAGVTTVTGAVATALDHVAALPESHADIRQGGRTFAVSDNVVVRISPEITAPGIEGAIWERGWVIVDDDPRVCDEAMPDSWGWPHCMLSGDDPEALYLEVVSGKSTGTDSYEVVIKLHRNTSVPYDGDLHHGTGFSDLSDPDSEYNRLAAIASGHPGVLGRAGSFRVLVNADGETRHDYNEPGKLHGPYRHTDAEIAWGKKYTACADEYEETGNRDRYRACMDDYLEIGRALLDEADELGRAAVNAIRGRK